MLLKSVHACTKFGPHIITARNDGKIFNILHLNQNNISVIIINILSIEKTKIKYGELLNIYVFSIWYCFELDMQSFFITISLRIRIKSFINTWKLKDSNEDTTWKSLIKSGRLTFAGLATFIDQTSFSKVRNGKISIH